MNENIRRLLDSAKEKIEAENKLAANERLKNDFFEEAKKNKHILYTKIVEELLKGQNGYIEMCTTNKKISGGSIIINDNPDKLNIIEREKIAFLQKNNYYHFPVVLAALDPKKDARYSDAHVNSAVLYIEGRDECVPVQLDIDDLSCFGFKTVFCRLVSQEGKSAFVKIIYTKDNITALVNGISSENPKYEPFLTDSIKKLVKEAQNKIEHYHTVMNNVEERVNNNADIIAYDIVEEIINQYNSTLSSFSIKYPCYVNFDIQTKIPQDELQFYNQYEIYTSKTIIFFNTDAKNQNGLLPVSYNRLEEILKEIGASFRLCYNNERYLYITVDTDKFTQIVQNKTK